MTSIEKSVGILGCGWLGIPLAQELISSGYSVNGTTTTEAKIELLSAAGISPFLLDLRSETTIPDAFMKVGALVILLPPKPENGDYSSYFSMLEKLAAAIKITPELSQVIFVSSTGVYPENAGEVTEENAQPHSAKASALLEAEEIFRKIKEKTVHVVRFGGLFGLQRHPGRFLAGKTEVTNGNAPINFLHLTDAVGLLSELIRQRPVSNTFNACADEHPERKEFYAKAAGLLRLTPPMFAPDTHTEFTLVNSSKIKQALGYYFQFPDPMSALETLPAAQTKN